MPAITCENIKPGLPALTSACVSMDLVLGEGCCIGRHVVIESNVRIGVNVQIGDGTFIGEGTRIGDDSVIGQRVTIREHSWIGKRVRIQAGVVIGSDGFGFAQRVDGTQFKIPQAGIVEIGDDCVIESQTTIDRATLGKTRLGDRVYLGPLVMLGHNVQIGNDSTIDAWTGISGSTRILAGAKIGQYSGLVGHLLIEEEVTLGSYSGVTKSLPKGIHLTGAPAMTPEQFEREAHLVHRLPEMSERIDKLEKIVEQSSLPTTS
jgi:UDP-3-O-[3-hydroxymyristoyl] glucosamine N-acyltransferase